MKKKFLTFAILTTFTIILLTSGCNMNTSDSNFSKSNKSGSTVIEIWHYYNGPQKIAFDNLITEFNETVGIEKNIVIDAINQGNVTDLTKKILDTANHKVGTGEIPNIFAAYPDTAYELDKMGMLTDLNPYLLEDEVNEYVTSYIEDEKINDDNELKIFPIAKSVEILMLNKTDWNVFSEATGISTDTLNTLEGLTKTAKSYYEWTDSLTKELDDGKAFFGRDAMANYFIIGSKSLGQEIITIQNGKASVNCDEKVMRKLWDNFYVPYINGYFTAYGKFRSDDAKTGDIIALVGSSSGSAYFPSEVVVNDTESYPIESQAFLAPTFENTSPYCIQQGAGMVVSKSTKEKEKACVEFLKWFTEEERNISFSINSGYLPVKKKANNSAAIKTALDNISDSTVSKSLYESTLVAVEAANTQELYTLKAFNNGTSVRNILETSMINKANEDLEAIKAQMAKGIRRKDAVKGFDTEENFQNWYHNFEDALIKAINS